MLCQFLRGNSPVIIVENGSKDFGIEFYNKETTGSCEKTSSIWIMELTASNHNLGGQKGKLTRKLCFQRQ